MVEPAGPRTHFHFRNAPSGPGSPQRTPGQRVNYGNKGAKPYGTRTYLLEKPHFIETRAYFLKLPNLGASQRGTRLISRPAGACAERGRFPGIPQTLTASFFKIIPWIFLCRGLAVLFLEGCTIHVYIFALPSIFCSIHIWNFEQHFVLCFRFLVLRLQTIAQTLDKYQQNVPFPLWNTHNALL